MTQSPRALITGASAGIGLTFARHLARTGHALILVARRADCLEEIAAELRDAHGIEVEVLAADLADHAGVAAITARLAADPPVDMLINNAGYAVRGTVAGLDPDALAQMVQVNIVAASRLAHAAMARMTAAGRGTIINVASGTVFAQFPGNAGYASSKNFIMAFTRHMQVEAEGTGVRIQLLIPGVIATDFHAVAGNDLSNFPADRVMQPDDLVVASLRALEMDEPVCIPSLPDIAAWEDYVAAEAAIWRDASKDRTAPRYH